MVSTRKIKKLLRVIPKLVFDKNLFLFSSNFAKRCWGRYKCDSSKNMPYPTTLMLELTNKCNLHCLTCPREHGYGREMEVGDMSFDSARKILDQALPYLGSLGLTGLGETLFAPNLAEVAKYVKQRKPGVIIFISTNANFPGFIEKVMPVLDHVDTIQVSTDGVGDTYEDIRVGASFDTLYKNLEALVPEATSRGVDVMFNMVITKRNFRSMPEVIRMAEKIGVGYVNFTCFNLASVTSVPVSYYDFFKGDEYRGVLELTKRVASECKDVEVTGLDFMGSPGIRKCGLMWNQFQINHDGEVPPCCAKPFPKEYSFGNVCDTPLIDVLNSDNAKQFRSHWVKGKPHPFCQKCSFVKL